MSKRRGKVLTDPESVERRQWYADLQRATIEEIAKENAYFEQERTREFEIAQERTPNKKRDNANIMKSNWLHFYNSAAEKTATVVCFPGIGQGASMFQKWNPFFSASKIHLCAITMPGRGNRADEASMVSVRNAAIEIFLSLKSTNMLERIPHRDNADEVLIRPLIFLGHDVGCLVAYEVAKLLQDYNYVFTALLMSACPSPYQQGQNKYGKKMCYLGDHELMQRMVELGGAPKYLYGRKDILSYFIPLFRSDYYLYDKYCITPPTRVLTISEGEIMDHLKADTGSHATSITQSVSHSTNHSTNHSANQSVIHTAIHSANQSTIHSVNHSVDHSAIHSANHSAAHSYANSRINSSSNLSVPAAVSSATSVASSYKSYNTHQPHSKTGSSVNSSGFHNREYKSTEYSEDNTEEQEEMVYPVVLYRLHCHIVTLLAEDDPFVSAKDVLEWEHMSNNYEHVPLSSATSPVSVNHTNALFHEDNEEVVFGIILKYCSCTLQDYSHALEES